MTWKVKTIVFLAATIFSAAACSDAKEDVGESRELSGPVPTWTNTPPVLFSIGTVVVPAPTRASPTATPQPPAPTPELLEGIAIGPDRLCSPYDRRDYAYFSSLKQKIIDGMGGRKYSPYTVEFFPSLNDAETDHIVALGEAHRSGLCAESLSVKRRFARDVLNLTLASPEVNRKKADKDLADWLPDANRCWFVMRVVEVKRKYALSMDLPEAERAEEVLKGCDDTSMQFPIGYAPTRGADREWAGWAESRRIRIDVRSQIVSAGRHKNCFCFPMVGRHRI